MDLDLATVDRLLTTTRSVRKRLDLARPVDPALLERAIEIALQAPTGSNSQGWHFVVVSDAEKRARIGALYRRAFEAYVNMPNAFRDTLAADDPRARQLPRIVDSATYLAHHLHEVPVLVIACIEGRVENAAGVALRVDPAGGVVADAGAPRPWPRLGLDDAAHHVRARGGGAARHSRARDAGGPAPRRSLQGRGLQARRTASGAPVHALERLGRATLAGHAASPSTGMRRRRARSSSMSCITPVTRA